MKAHVMGVLMPSLMMAVNMVFMLSAFVAWCPAVWVPIILAGFGLGYLWGGSSRLYKKGEVTVVTGLTGFYMLHFLDAWDRYLSLAHWWIHLMTLVGVLFTLVLFVLEPLVLHRWFHVRATADSERAFRLVLAMHVVLLALSLVAVAGGVAGAHGYDFGAR